MTHSPCHPQTAPGGFGNAWPAILALTQANRDAAAALLLAMQAFGDPSGHAMQPDEMHCWYTDAHDAADVASQAADTLKLLTTNASIVPATTGAAPVNAAAQSHPCDSPIRTYGSCGASACRIAECFGACSCAHYWHGQG